MASKILLKLIDKAIIPALLLLTGKYAALLLISRISGFIYTPSLSYGFIPVFQFMSPQEGILAHNYSNICMYALIFIGFFWIIVRSSKFHDTHISPKQTSRLAQRNLLFLLTNSYNIYSAALVWFLFLWIAVLIMGIYSGAGLTYWSYTISAVICNLLLSYLLVEDIEGEIRVRRFTNS